MTSVAHPPEERTCANCYRFGWKRRDIGGWAFCSYMEMWVKEPGKQKDRACWEQKAEQRKQNAGCSR